ncbi:YrdC-like domain-containing protein [Aphelenchoides fujianensis]|nr:YrdC-like domain-containing protein [Aphelenchoides fujianensis]
MLKRALMSTTNTRFIGGMRPSEDRSTAVRETIDVLNAGGCVALPTDTLYGLVTLLRFSARLFEVKQRDEGKPVGFFVHSPAVIRKFAVQTVEDGLLDRLLPGRVTLLFRRLDSVGLPQTTPSWSASAFPTTSSCASCAETRTSRSPRRVLPTCGPLLGPADRRLSRRKMDEKRQGSTIIDLSEAGGYRICRPGCSLAAYEAILQEHGLKPL